MAPDTPDNGFELLRAELREFRGELTAFRGEVRGELSAFREEFRGELSATEARLRQQIADSQAETRRHAGVIAEELTSKIDLVIEGVKGVDERLERFRGEVHGEFQQADRRFLRLEARILGRP